MSRAAPLLKVMTACIIILAILAWIAGCHVDKPLPGSGPYRIAMILPGRTDDGSWSMLAGKALDGLAREFRAQTSLHQEVRPEQANAILTPIAAANEPDTKADLIILVGAQFGVAAENIAVAFPNSRFLLIGNESGNNRNLAVVQWRNIEIAGVLGHIAALKTKTRKIGFIGGVPYSSITECGDGFEQGAQAKDPTITTVCVYLDSWTDTEKARQAARDMIADGCDVILINADSAGLAAHAEADAAGVYSMGWTVDCSSAAPNHCLTSAVIRMDTTIIEMVRLARLGRLEGKKHYLGLRDRAMELAPFNGMLTPDEEASVWSVWKGVINGDIRFTREKKD